MVVLNKIYTKTGDAGETALGNGARVAKHAMRVTAYGTSDELNCFVGVARLEAAGDVDDALSRIQNDLFDLGPICAVPTWKRTPKQNIHRCGWWIRKSRGWKAKSTR